MNPFIFLGHVNNIALKALGDLEDEIKKVEKQPSSFLSAIGTNPPQPSNLKQSNWLQGKKKEEPNLPQPRTRDKAKLPAHGFKLDPMPKK